MNLHRNFSGHSKHSIFIDADGTLLIWGNNENYASGLPPSRTFLPQPLLLSETSKPDLVQVAVGLSHTLALTRDSKIFVWGNNGEGELGFDPATSPVVQSPTLLQLPASLADQKISKVACGAFYSMILTQDGVLYSFGENVQGQLGLGRGNRKNTWTPSLVAFPAPMKIIDVACGFNHVLALSAEGEVHVWGQNKGGKLGGNFDDDYSAEVPVKLENLENIVGVYANFHSMALTRDGALYVWGWGGLGSLGLGNLEDKYSPEVLFKGGVVSVACGGGHSLVLLDDGRILGWGCNDAGQLGIGSPVPKSVPTLLPLSAELLALGQIPFTLGCLYDHSFLVTNKGDLYLWGLGQAGQLGLGHYRNKKRPTKLGFRVKAGVNKEGEWRAIFQWLFLGRVDAGSPFFVLPQEVVYFFVVMEWNQ
jgi:alpha-tubulin suppressor-like RCC1 family protein